MSAVITPFIQNTIVFVEIVVLTRKLAKLIKTLAKRRALVPVFPLFLLR